MRTPFLLPALALGGAAVLLAPAPRSSGYSLLGDSLGLSQRDFRLFNNFVDPETNDNVTPDDNFPGFDGAEMAIWKGCIEWGSELHGAGNGDPSQPGGLGSGGANFDPSFQGNAASVGGTGDNIHSAISGGGGGVLAFAEGGLFTSGWRIRYYESHTWTDGPGPAGFGEWDLQGIACHEYGHALGLGHSLVGGTTMFATASASGNAQRSIEADDVAGVQAIYGPRSPSKPRIFSTSVNGSSLTINGSGFSGGGNEVWFTNGNVTSAGSDPFVVVSGVSSSGGGTTITVNVPGAAGAGDVLVRRNASGNAALSNAWPVDPSGGPGAPTLTGVTPATANAVNQGAVTVTVNGNGFDTTLDVQFDGQSVPFVVQSDNALTFDFQVAPKLGAVTVGVQTLFGTGTTQMNIVANDPPELLNEAAVIFSGTNVDFTVGALPGSVVYLASSPDNTPSVLPGLISADIGAGFTTITLVSISTGPADGSLELAFPISGLPPFSTVYFQVAVFDTLGTLPMPVSNVASVLVI